MTREETKQEAEEKCVCTDQTLRIMYRIGYIDGAESREKRIEELEEENNKLLDVINNQDVKIADLEQQIEEIKCCANCSKYDRNNRVCSRTKFSVIETLCNCSDDWELRR